MTKKFIAMLDKTDPGKDPEVIFAFPAGRYPTGKLCSLFLTRCRELILSEPDRPREVMLDLYGENAGLVMHCSAGNGDGDRLDFDLREVGNVRASGRMPSRMTRYRDNGSFGPSGWDSVDMSNGATPDEYAMMLDAFLKRDASAAT